MLGQVDDWLAEMFAPANIDATLDCLPGRRPSSKTPPHVPETEAARARIAEYDGRISATAQAWTRAGEIPP